jgi:hypothetical protein
MFLPLQGGGSFSSGRSALVRKSFRHKKAQKAQKNLQAFVRFVRFAANVSFVVLQAKIKPDNAEAIPSNALPEGRDVSAS